MDKAIRKHTQALLNQLVDLADDTNSARTISREILEIIKAANIPQAIAVRDDNHVPAHVANTIERLKAEVETLRRQASSANGHIVNQEKSIASREDRAWVAGALSGSTLIQYLVNPNEYKLALDAITILAKAFPSETSALANDDPVSKRLRGGIKRVLNESD